MNWQFGAVILFLMGIILVQYKKNEKRSHEISYIEEKIRTIMAEQSLERVQVVTSDKEIGRLNEAINELLDYNHKNLAAYNQTRTSMKKMLSNVSHDLKTPLTVVLGYLEMLTIKEGEATELRVVYQKVQEVLALINSFFDLAKLESGDKKTEISRIDLTETIRQSIVTLSLLLEKSGMEIEVSIPDQEYYILGNEEAIARIMENLISNAVKYGCDGKYLGIHFDIKEDKGMISVIDHGKGIERRNQKEVFERLYILEDSRSSKYQGNGLGLAITQALVQAMNGTIKVRSIPFKETVFTIEFQLLEEPLKEKVRNE